MRTLIPATLIPPVFVCLGEPVSDPSREQFLSMPPPHICSFMENDYHIFYGVQPKQTPILLQHKWKFSACDPTRYAASLMNCLAGCRHTAGTVITHRISSPSRTVDDWSFTSCGGDEDESFDIERVAPWGRREPLPLRRGP